MTGLLSVEDALARVLAGVRSQVEVQELPIAQAAGRTLAADLAARRTQPPFRASAMDGYAVRSQDVARLPATLRLVGSSAAGHGFAGQIGEGETVRIFTGAPVPEGADAVLIQEEAEATGERVTARASVAAGGNIRRAGTDFSQGDPLLRAGETLDARRLALAAAAGHGQLALRRKPRVAILATGDELVRPGAPAAWDQIVASNALALAAMAEEAGAEPIDLGIAGDDLDALKAAIGRARDARADLLVTLGGASVGDHDLVQPALAAEGMELGFWRIALRPGKPLMFGRLGALSDEVETGAARESAPTEESRGVNRSNETGYGSRPMLVIGLPGNPVSAIVCGLLFVVPAIRALLGDPEAGADRSEPARLGSDLPANEKRQDYMRARLASSPDGLPIAHPENRQDSSMLAVLGRSEALLIRPPHAPAARSGDPCRIIRLDRRLV